MRVHGSSSVRGTDASASISDPAAREYMRAFRKDAIPAEAIARAISYAISQPADLDGDGGCA